MDKLLSFLRNWTLPVAMAGGVLAYFIYTSIPFLVPTRPFVASAVSIVQPALIFCMLFVTFCKVAPGELRITRWHAWNALIQAGSFVMLAAVIVVFNVHEERLLIESAMICMICPTATAAAVVTAKLGGNSASLTTYTIIANIITALIVPTILPIIHPHDGMTFVPMFMTIMAKVFPILICPLFLAWFVRFQMPAFHRKVTSVKDLAFYLWAISLSIAIAVTTKAIVHNDTSIWHEVGIAVVSLVCCALQFAIGKVIGSHYGDRISAGQALGQKNTVFAIWMGYTFLSPVTAMAGGFYSIWHNIVNSYQLYKKRNESKDK